MFRSFKPRDGRVRDVRFNDMSPLCGALALTGCEHARELGAHQKIHLHIPSMGILFKRARRSALGRVEAGSSLAKGGRRLHLKSATNLNGHVNCGAMSSLCPVRIKSSPGCEIAVARGRTTPAVEEIVRFGIPGRLGVLLKIIERKSATVENCVVDVQPSHQPSPQEWDGR